MLKIEFQIKTGIDKTPDKASGNSIIEVMNFTICRRITRYM